jgi:hypothetical protein
VNKQSSIVLFLSLSASVCLVSSVLRDNAIAMVLERHHKVAGTRARGMEPFLLLWLWEISDSMRKEVMFVSSPARLSHISGDRTVDFIFPT